MSVATLIVEPDQLERPRLEVTGSDYRHLFRARRMAVGERLRVVDGRGRAAWARVERVTSGRAELVAEGAAPSNEPRRELEIWACLPRPRRASWLVEKATELGVGAVRWIDSERAGREIGAPALERLRRVARAAVEQCQRSRVPEITGLHAWTEVLSSVESAEQAWLLDPQAPAPAVGSGVARTLLLVGPEGGFVAAEIEELLARGARPAGLGPRLLRIETAALAGAALLLAPRAARCDEPV